MALEIERKFLVKGDFSGDVSSSSRIVQGYLAASPMASVRVRVYGEKGYMTVKGRPTRIERKAVSSEPTAKRPIFRTIWCLRSAAVIWTPTK